MAESTNTQTAELTLRNPSAIDWERLLGILRDHERFVLVTHIRPDCDAIGSQLGMAMLLESMGKDVACINDFHMPPHLAFLEDGGRLRKIGEPGTQETLEAAEVLIVLDTTAWAQLGAMGDRIRSFGGKKLVIDHHVSADDLGAELFKNTEAEATGRLITELVAAAGMQPTPAMATALLSAVATDTGWFRFSSVTGDTYRVASYLIDCGAAPDRLYRDLYENERLPRFRLAGCAMQRACVEEDGRLIHTYLTRADFEECGAVPSDSEDIINTTLSVGGTKVAVILIEQPSGEFKVSFRSRTSLDCSKVAARFGGGGHKAAAGATVPGPLDDAQRNVLDAVRAAMQE
ncbi:DHHA1 domain-containing protein [Thermostilla marina]